MIASLTRTCHAAGTRVTRANAEPALYVVMRGTLVETVARRRYALHGGCAMFVPAEVRHVRVCDVESLVLHVTVPAEYAPPAAIADCTGRAWAMTLIRELERRDSRWDVIAEGLLLQGLGWLARLAESASERPPWLDDVTDLARQQQPLGTIAVRIGRHASHIAREFRRHQGVSVGEFARRCRLELAAASLKSNSGSIADVALAAGFCDQSHFTNAFRRVFGMTPAAYRGK